MREKLFTLSRMQREDMWRRFKQTDDHRVAERLHAILLLESGQNAQAVGCILHVHSKTLRRLKTNSGSNRLNIINRRQRRRSPRQTLGPPTGSTC